MHMERRDPFRDPEGAYIVERSGALRTISSASAWGVGSTLSRGNAITTRLPGETLHCPEKTKTAANIINSTA